MTDDERTLSGDASETPIQAQPQGAAPGPERLSTMAVETPLDLDEVMSQARRVERTARICIRGDLTAEYEALLEELSELVDEHGVPLNDDEQSLGEIDRATEINNELLPPLREQMRAAMRYVRFRALPDDKWEAFEKEFQDDQGNYKDLAHASNVLISRTAIQPTMTLQKIEELRTELGPTQIAELARKAFKACTTGGVDIPKSPPFSPFQRRDSSGRN